MKKTLLAIFCLSLFVFPKVSLAVEEKKEPVMNATMQEEETANATPEAEKKVEEKAKTATVKK